MQKKKKKGGRENRRQKEGMKEGAKERREVVYLWGVWYEFCSKDDGWGQKERNKMKRKNGGRK